MSTTPGESGRTEDTPQSSEAARAADKLGRTSEQVETTASGGQSQTPQWYVFKGVRSNGAGQSDGAPSAPPQPAVTLPVPPPWRDFTRTQAHKGVTFRASSEEIRVVNAAIYLRRPLLLTGLPGTGKSSLAYAIAEELGLGEVLVWPITSRSQLKDGLYSYDAIGRLQASNMSPRGGTEPEQPPPIGHYLRLGPLGTALADSRPNLPRVLLIDEIDKSDIDLPNDLLNVFEDGEFEIQELARLASRGDKESRLAAQPSEPIHRVEVRLHRSRDMQSSRTIEVVDGRVRCQEFPIVLLTSNGERALPGPFLRRCLRLDIKPPDEAKLQKIIRAHFKDLREDQQLPDAVLTLIRRVVERRNNSSKREYVATDQLMNAVHLVLNNIELTSAESADQDRRATKQLIDFVLEAIGTSLV